MAHWKHEEEREDGDTHDETHDEVIKTRKWLRSEADKNKYCRDLMSDLRSIELMATPFFLGLDYNNDDRDDVDDIGPF